MFDIISVHCSHLIAQQHFQKQKPYVMDFFIVSIDTVKWQTWWNLNTTNIQFHFDAYISSKYFRIIRESFGMGMDTLIEHIQSHTRLIVIMPIKSFSFKTREKNKFESVFNLTIIVIMDISCLRSWFSNTSLWIDLSLWTLFFCTFFFKKGTIKLIES